MTKTHQSKNKTMNEHQIIDMMNSTDFKLFKSSAYALLYKCNDVVFKFVFISPIVISHTHTNMIITDPNSKEIRTIKQKMFVNEINAHCDIYYKSCDDPICPQLLFATHSFESLLDQFGEQPKQTIKIIKKIFNAFNNIDSAVKIGLIVMEKLESYESAFNLKFNENMHSLCAYSLIRLAIQTQYFHGDHHMNNIMIDSADRSYFRGLHIGKPLLIDFAYSTKIKDDDMEEIMRLFTAKQYVAILDIINNQYRLDDSKISEFDSTYGYMSSNSKYNAYQDGLNERINYLFELRENMKPRNTNTIMRNSFTAIYAKKCVSVNNEAILYKINFIKNFVDSLPQTEYSNAYDDYIEQMRIGMNYVLQHIQNPDKSAYYEAFDDACKLLLALLDTKVLINDEKEILLFGFCIMQICDIFWNITPSFGKQFNKDYSANEYAVIKLLLNDAYEYRTIMEVYNALLSLILQSSYAE